MSRRLSAVLLAVVLAAAVAPSALGARVHVRVEGKTTTIFGAAQPVLDVKGPDVSIPEIPHPNALDALEAASVAGEFYYHVAHSSFGSYVDQIGRHRAGGQSGWVFKVNGVSPPVGADRVRLRDGDVVLWYHAEFGSAGGPKTLLLQRRGRNCYRVLAQDDQGRSQAAVGAVLHVGGRRVRTRAGRACVGRHRGLVRATMPSAVRSNALP